MNIYYIDKWKVKNSTLIELFRGVNLIIGAASIEPKTQVVGTVLVVDLNGMTPNHVWQFTPNYAKLVLDWIQVSINILIVYIRQFFLLVGALTV